MTRAGGESLEPDMCRAQLGSPNSGHLALDVQVAARTKIPVLISAPPACALSVARAIAAYSGKWLPCHVVMCDCAGGDDLEAAVAAAQSVPGRHPSEVILLLREVHALGAAAQAAVARLIAAWHPGWETPRIISTCSVSLFDRVREGAFDEQLFYSLNALHLVVRTD